MGSLVRICFSGGLRPLIFGLCLLLALCFAPVFSVLAQEDDVTQAEQKPQPETSPWQQLEPGAQLAVFTHHRVQDQEPLPDLEIVVVRLDPAYFDFSLLCASELGSAAKSFEDWGKEHAFQAAINAGMFLPDALTNTGYLRNARHVNNGHVASKFGAFFMSDPIDPSLPNAQLVDRTQDAWKELLPHYRNIVQNYRLISAEGRVLWAPDGAEYAVAAVGSDHQGNILFIHCREAVRGDYLGQTLLALPLNLRMAMYVEGGNHAMLSVRMRGFEKVWKGKRANDFLSSPLSSPVPNLLVAVRRTKTQTP